MPDIDYDIINAPEPTHEEMDYALRWDAFKETQLPTIESEYEYVATLLNFVWRGFGN